MVVATYPGIWFNDFRSSSLGDALSRTSSEAETEEVARLLAVHYPKAPADPGLLDSRTAQLSRTSAFESLFRARGERRERLISGFIADNMAADVLAIGLEQFHARGNQDRLVLTATILHSFGEHATAALASIVKRGSSQAEYFVELLVDLARDDKNAADLVKELAQSPSEDVKLRLADNLLDAEPGLAGEVARIMRADRIRDTGNTAVSERD